MLQDEVQEQAALTEQLQSKIAGLERYNQLMGEAKEKIHLELCSVMKREVDAIHALMTYKTRERDIRLSLAGFHEPLEPQKDPKECLREVSQSNVWSKRDGGGCWRKRRHAALPGPKQTAQLWWKCYQNRQRSHGGTCNGD